LEIHEWRVLNEGNEMKSNLLKSGLVLAGVMALVACGGGGSAEPAATPVTLNYTINGVAHSEAAFGMSVKSGELVNLVVVGGYTNVQDDLASGACGADISKPDTSTYNATYVGGACMRHLTVTTSKGNIRLEFDVAAPVPVVTAPATTTSTGTTTGGTTTTTTPPATGTNWCTRPVTDAEWAAGGGAAATGGVRPTVGYAC
jgi:hypothetical protein